MTGAKGPRKIWPKLLLLLVVLTLGAVSVVVESGLIDRWTRVILVLQLEKLTGARVEIGAFHFHLLRLRAEMDGVTMHGREEKGLPPLFHAARVTAGIRLLSFFGRRFALSELVIDHPDIFIRIDQNEESNIPAPRAPTPEGSWRGPLFDLQIAHLRLENGSCVFNDVRVPLAVEANNFQFGLTYAGGKVGGSGEAYVGTAAWNRMLLVTHRYLPFRSDVSLKFTLTRSAFSLEELRWKLPHSEVDLRADLASFARPDDWSFRYRGKLALDDINTVMRQPQNPNGAIDFTGNAQYQAGQWSGNGHFRATGVNLPYMWFHSKNVDATGDFQLARDHLAVPQFVVHALGGSLAGRLEADLHTWQFHAVSQGRGMSIPDVFAAVDNPNFPIRTIHWSGNLDVDSTSTWSGGFEHFHSFGESRWSPNGASAPNQVPVTARIEYDYAMDTEELTLAPSEISTPTTQMAFHGFLGADSAIELHLETQKLQDWDDFINILRGSDVPPEIITGQVIWDGKILGPIVSPTFAGKFHSTQPRYSSYHWDDMAGELSYNANELKIPQAHITRGAAAADLDLEMHFDDWSFLPASPWALHGKTDRAPVDDIQKLFGVAYAFTGLASGNFAVSGTRADPVFAGNFVVDDGTLRGLQFTRLRGDVEAHTDEVSVSNGHLDFAGATVAGDISYRFAERDSTFHLTGNDVPLERIPRIQAWPMPVAGLLSFQVQGSGALLAPSLQGTVRLVNLRMGLEVEGDFTGKLAADGQTLSLDVNSQSSKSSLQGHISLGLHGDYPIAGDVNIAQFDLDPFISAGLHLKNLTGHSSVDAHFRLSGPLRQPDNIEADAEISRAAFDYEYVKLQNTGPVKISYRRNEVRIDQAHFNGPSTDLQLAGLVRFNRDRPLDLHLSGSINLRLLVGFFPGLEANGAAMVNAAISGTISRPRITGRSSVSDASGHYEDFPTGLSHVTGEFLFDTDRLIFDNVTAEAGGGKISLSGSVNYGTGELEYLVNVAAPRLLIRYPEGMSWLAGGNLQLSGTASAGVLSGNVQVERMLLGAKMDLATFFASSSETSRGSSTSSPFLRNLQFDISGTTTPSARLEWASAHVEIDGDVRLRGTWDRPLLLGHIHLLSGEMVFRGNNYRVTRGDINFSNPFRLDPVLNVEATSQISQYEVTIDFTGPASRLTLSYRSDPPLPDSDIVALLALGTPGEESALRSSTSGSQNYGATALLSEAISSQLGGRIEHLFGISNFRVDPFLAGTTTEQNAAARVTIEKQITKDFLVTYSSNATSQQYQVIQVEYTVRRDISILFLRDLNGTYSFTVEFKKHIK
jgi:translocation and assembly module TamB